MDNKYGYLFTSQDMITFARIFAGSGLNFSNDQAAEALLDDFQGRFPKDEPLFLVRGQDLQAINCVRNYRTMVAYSGRKEPDPGFLAGLHAVVTQFEEFARDHPDRMKDPD